MVARSLCLQVLVSTLQCAAAVGLNLGVGVYALVRTLVCACFEVTQKVGEPGDTRRESQKNSCLIHVIECTTCTLPCATEGCLCTLSKYGRCLFVHGSSRFRARL